MYYFAKKLNFMIFQAAECIILFLVSLYIFPDYTVWMINGRKEKSVA
jgi:hypothetical protein